MKLLLLGATGRTGQLIIKEALSQGHVVTAYVRQPEKLKARSGLTIIKGDLMNEEELTEAMRGQEVVLVALGNTLEKKRDPFFVRFFPIIISAMEKAGIRRLISLSALGVGQTIQATRLLFRLGVAFYLREIYADHEAAERLLEETTLDWTTIHPGGLTNGSASEQPIIRPFKSGELMPLLSRTSRSDVARLFIQLLDDAETYGKQILLAGAK